MTQIGNPYGDTGGQAPDWDMMKSQYQSVFNQSLLKSQAKRQDIFRQFGISGNGNMQDILNGAPGANDFALDAGNQQGVFQQKMAAQAGAGGALRMNLKARGIQDSGVAGQVQGDYDNARHGELDLLRQNVLGQLTGNTQEAFDAKGLLGQQNLGVDKGRSDFQGWGDTHYASEGGNIADPTDFALGSDQLKGSFAALKPNLKDKVVAGAQLGRIRQSLDNMLATAGTEGYDNTMYKSYVAQYKQMLKAAGYDYKGKWVLPGEVDQVNAATAAAEAARKARVNKAQSHLKADKAKAKKAGGAQAGGAKGYKRPGK